MSDLIRDAPVGQVIRWLTRNRVLLYPEEKADFVCPACYSSEADKPASDGSPGDTPAAGAPEMEKTGADVLTPGAHSLQTPATVRDVDPFEHTAARESLRGPARTLSKIVSRAELDKASTRADLEEAYSRATLQESVRQEPAQPIVPEKTADGVVLVDWYTTDDAENPQNWSRGKKGLVILQVYLYTLAVYMGSAIYTPSEPYVIKALGVSATVASLGLALYVLGYGVGPLIFSPLSEIPAIGRNPPYMVTFGIFVALCVPTALVNDIGPLLVLRFLQGFFGSPCLATGGASISDIYSLLLMPYFLTLWAGFATCGPALGPLISGFSVPATNWHWSLWEILWLSGPIFVSLFFLLPETNSDTILLRRAARLRRLTGNPTLKSQSEIDQARLTVREVVVTSLWHPLQINALDPAVLFTSVYIALVYGIYYSFFEVFPIVYVEGYGFNLGQMGLVFTCITVAVILSSAAYWSYLYWVANPEIMTKGLPPPEKRLIPAIYASFLPPIGLFIFAWTGNDPAAIPWIAPTIGVTVYTVGVFMLIQCIFIYIPLSYPQYAASLFAGNDFFRSALAAGAILFARPLFINLGVGRGVTLLAGLTVTGILGILALWHYGAALRSRSRFALG